MLKCVVLAVAVLMLAGGSALKIKGASWVMSSQPTLLLCPSSRTFSFCAMLPHKITRLGSREIKDICALVYVFESV